MSVLLQWLGTAVCLVVIVFLISLLTEMSRGGHDMLFPSPGWRHPIRMFWVAVWNSHELVSWFLPGAWSPWLFGLALGSKGTRLCGDMSTFDDAAVFCTKPYKHEGLHEGIWERWKVEWKDGDTIAHMGPPVPPEKRVYSGKAR